MIAIEQIAGGGALDRCSIKRLAIARQPDDECDLRVIRADRRGLRGLRARPRLRCRHRRDESAREQGR